MQDREWKRCNRCGAEEENSPDARLNEVVQYFALSLEELYDLKIEDHGEFITTDNFWDCECDDNYIHISSNLGTGGRKMKKKIRLCEWCDEPNLAEYRIIIFKNYGNPNQETVQEDNICNSCYISLQEVWGG